MTIFYVGNIISRNKKIYNMQQACSIKNGSLQTEYWEKKKKLILQITFLEVEQDQDTGQDETYINFVI